MSEKLLDALLRIIEVAKETCRDETEAVIETLSKFTCKSCVFWCDVGDDWGVCENPESPREYTYALEYETCDECEVADDH